MPSPLRLVFAGTPEFAAVQLRALLGSPHRVVAVYTRPDRRAGRGRRLRPGPVKRLAERHGLPLCQPASLAGEAAVAGLRARQADAMVVAAYGLLLPPPVLRVPRLGCINVHASLLPRWRGAAPVERAILAGDAETGVTIMQMDAGLDTGDILHQERCAIDARDTAGALLERLAGLGAQALLRTLAELAAGRARPRPQDPALATHAPRIDKSEARLDWRLAAPELERRVRAFNPRPVAWTTLGGQPLRIWEAAALATTPPPHAAPGEVLAAATAGLDVAAGGGALRLLTVQRAGGRALPAGDFLNARPLAPGTRLE